MQVLYSAFPELKNTLSHLQLAVLPTPVIEVTGLVPTGSTAQVFIKQDGQSGTLYGGNKVRKLEYLLGDALERGMKAVLTFGAAGSNHALATAIYAREQGLDCISMLGSQLNAHAVRKNLLRHLLAGADICFAGDRTEMAHRTRERMYHYYQRDGRFPAVIPSGGSSPVGVIGFVNAAFELRRQVEEGLLPEPDIIYVASGTMGTCTGLMIGLLAAEMKSTVMAVRVTPPPFSDYERGRLLFDATCRLLHEADAAFPLLPFPEERFVLREGFYGGEYGLFTDASVQAVRTAHQQAGVKLEGTYTGKTFAALLEDGRNGALEGKNALFWNTYNARDFSSLIADADYHQLPGPFQHFFEEEVQLLDRQP